MGSTPSRPATRRPSPSIMIPPPNVTGVLHMGHALNNTIQDIVIRYRRMLGLNEALWLPGTDHAGIATQAVVEKQAVRRSRRSTREDLGREAFLEPRSGSLEGRVHGDKILHQLERLGCSCDWSRTRFTFEPKVCRARCARPSCACGRRT